MAITGMNHFTVLTDDVERTVDFYRATVGLEPGPRPDLGFPGAWLYVGDQAVLHVIGGRSKDQLKPGVLDHMAFSANGLAATLKRLDTLGVHYAHRRQAGYGTWQVFFFDPNGARVELDFDPSEPAPDAAKPDHLVYAATTLAQGIDYFADLTGVVAQPGGKHFGMGTHNALVRLGERLYLEIIAIDPDAPAPPRRRWFDLDDGDLRADLIGRPMLVHWVARTRALEQAVTACGYEPGPILPFSRNAYRWRITVPDDGRRPGRGLLPTLIQWESAHPADALPHAGVSLEQLAATHPDPAPIRRSLERLGLADDMRVTFDRVVRLAAMLRTPRGLVAL